MTSKFTSESSVFAKMPLLGGTVIQQTESWNKTDKQYQVAVLVCWSIGLEEAARAAMTGEPLLTGPQGDKSDTVQEWIKKQDLGAMVGSRQYLDGKGQRHFLGITARPVSRNAAKDSENRDLAAESAQVMTVYSLFADVDTTVTAKQMATESTTSDPDASVLKAGRIAQQSAGAELQEYEDPGPGAAVGDGGRTSADRPQDARRRLRDLARGGPSGHECRAVQPAGGDPSPQGPAIPQGTAPRS